MNTTHTTLLSSLRALPRPAWVLFLGSFINKFGAFVVPFLALYLTRRGYSVGQAAIAVSAYGMGNFAASVLGGWMADSFGRRKTIVFSMFSVAVVMVMLSQARSLPMIIVLTALAGLTGELYRPACSALLADVIPTGQRLMAYATYRMAFNAGFAFGPATAGFLAVYGFFWLFAGDAMTSALFGLLAFFALPRGMRSSQHDASWATAIQVLRFDSRLHQVLLANLCIGLVFFQFASTFSLYITSLGFSAATYGALISLNGLVVVFCELPLTAITRRFRARRMMALGYALIGTGFVLNAFAHTVPALAICMIVFTLGEIAAMPTSVAYIADLAPPHMRGRYMGASGLTWATALIFGPALGMKTYELRPDLFWAACGLLALLATVVISAPQLPVVSANEAAEELERN